MKIAVGSLLLLATLLQYQFKTGSACGQSFALRRRELLMGSSRRLGRIVGGENTADCSVIPWQVQVNAGKGLCGGSIISKNHILTAAHCLKRVNNDASQVMVRVADHKTNVRDEEIFGVKTLKVHELYDPLLKEHDIAILTLNESLKYKACVAPICLDPTFVPYGDDCIAAGWGLMGDESYSTVLKMVKLQAYKGSDCQQAFGFFRKNYVRNETLQICAGYRKGGRDTCQGDSGGPLVCWRNGRYVQAGIASYGKDCALANWPSIQTNVPYYYGWIKNYINIAQSPA